jgi:hypothetical protein
MEKIKLEEKSHPSKDKERSGKKDGKSIGKT